MTQMGGVGGATPETFRLVDVSRTVNTYRGSSYYPESPYRACPVDVENPPVLRETMFTDAETDGWRAEDVTKDAVTEFLPVLVA